MNYIGWSEYVAASHLLKILAFLDGLQIQGSEGNVDQAK